MATEQDTSERDAVLRPQTPAARRSNPGAHSQRSAAERERLREESRARRRARNGDQVVPEPRAHQIKVRRLSETTAPAARPPEVAPQPERPSALRPSTPAGGRVAPAEPLDEEPGAGEALDARALEAELLEAEPLDDALLDDAPPASPRFERAAAADGAPPGDPPAQSISLPAGFPALPSLTSERIAMLGIAATIGVLICLAVGAAAGGLPGVGGGMKAKASSRVVAPGGWLTLSGSDAPAHTDVILESRTRGGPWHTVATAPADGSGDFDLRGRVLAQPGPIQVRTRAEGGATTNPMPVTVRPLRLAAVGDINLGDSPGAAIAANGPAYPWRATGKALASADLAFGNLECAISTRGEPYPKQYNFRGTPAAQARQRRSTGIDVLNLANNHVGDYGPAATVDTVRGVERLGMKAVGAGPNLRRALAPQVVERLGLRVAFVGFSEIAPVEFAAGPGRPGTAWARPEQIAAAVQAARRRADVVVATFHWGIEKQTLETAQQRALADVAVRNGAQIVIGAHPHTLQPVRRQGGAIVAYSLGNFVFGAHSPETTSTGILQLGLTAEGVSKASWRAAQISGDRPVLGRGHAKRLPLQDGLEMQAGVNLPEL